MATPPVTIYGKTDCVSYYRGGTGATHFATLAGDFYTSLFKFLQTLSTSGVVDLVTYNTGAGGTGIGYWNEATRFGSGPFSVWKFKASGERTWDWYFYMHCNSGSSAGSYEETAAQTPTKVLGSATTDGASIRSVIVQAAICLSTSLTGSVSVNPWNGTISAGAATKTTPVWSTASNPNNQLFVFPRQNYLTGANVTNKDNCMRLARFHTNLPRAEARWNFFSDGHGLAVAQMFAESNAIYQRRYMVHYFGPYRLSNAVTQSNPGNVIAGTGSLGFICFASQPPGIYGPSNGNFKTNTIPDYTQIGQRTNADTVIDGGMLATLDKGIRVFMLANDYSAGLVFPYQPNIFMNYKIVERPYSVVGYTEAGFQGFTGWVDSVLIRSIGNGYVSGDTATNDQRAIFGAGVTPANDRMITMPWHSASMPPGSTMLAIDAAQRDGFTFSIPNYSI